MKKLLRKVSKGKSRDQPFAPGGSSGGIMDKIKHGIMWLGKEVSQSSGAAVTTAGTSHGGERRGSHGLIGKLIKKKPDKDDEKAKVLDNENEGEQESSQGSDRKGKGLLGKFIKKKSDLDDEKGRQLDNENEGEQESSQGGDRKGKGLLGKFIKKKPDLDDEKGRQLDNKEQDS